MIGFLMKKMGKYNSFEMIQNYDIAIIKKLSYVPLFSVFSEPVPVAMIVEAGCSPERRRNARS